MTPTIAPYPNLDSPAWTLLIKAPPGQIITHEIAAAVIGPDLAMLAIAQLETKHLLEGGKFMPLALKLREWNRAK